MTISTTSPIENYSYSGPGQYDFEFTAYDEDHITVVYTDTDGLQTTLIKDSQFLVTLDSQYDGGYIVTSDPSDTDGTLSIRRVVPLEQQTDYVNNDAFDMDVLERDLDTVVMMIQQINTTVSEGLVTVDWKGTWTTAEDYGLRDMVTGPDTNIYICNIAHTAGTFTTDLAAGYWIKVVDVEAATDAAAAALISEANASTSEDNAANCALASYTSAAAASTSAANAYASELAADAARDQLLDMYSTNTRTHFTMPTSGSVPIDPDNGALQILNQTSGVTLTDSLTDTQMTEVMIKTNGNALTMPTVTWVNTGTYNISSTLWNCYRFWKVGSTLYGAVLNS